MYTYIYIYMYIHMYASFVIHMAEAALSFMAGSFTGALAEADHACGVCALYLHLSLSLYIYIYI